MAQSEYTLNQATLIQSLKDASRSPTVTPNQRHPQSVRSVRWTMGRADPNFYFPSSGLDYMQWWVNPSECQWKMATRTTVEKISGGVVHHEWPQTGMYGANFSQQGSRFDQPMISFTFQTGIITPGGYNDIMSGEDTSTAPTPGLGNFFDFLELLDQPDVTEQDGEPNYINIIYVTPVFGQKGIWLQGFFTEEGVAWTDSAEHPNQITSWGATFMVFNSQPRFSQLLANFEMIQV